MGLFGLKRDRAKQKVEELLSGAEAPTFKESSLRVLDRLRDPDVEFDEVAEALQWDPGLSLKVLAVANSAAYSPRQQIGDVRHAVSFLGRAKLEQLALAIAVSESLPKGDAPGFDARCFWRASARRAGIAQKLSQMLHPSRTSEAFTPAARATASCWKRGRPSRPSAWTNSSASNSAGTTVTWAACSAPPGTCPSRSRNWWPCTTTRVPTTSSCCPPCAWCP
jgi:hypothetical protein